MSSGALINEIASRVGHYGLGAWLTDLGLRLGVSAPYPPSLAPGQFVVTKGNGLRITLYEPSQIADAKVLRDAYADSLVFYDATIAGDQPLPFGLAGATETPDSARTKLSDDVSWGKPAADGSHGVSYFLEDFRVVTVVFRQSRAGIAEVILTRLFTWPDWRRRR